MRKPDDSASIDKRIAGEFERNARSSPRIGLCPQRRYPDNPAFEPTRAAMHDIPPGPAAAFAPDSAEARRQALYLTLAQVPAGKVVSYGQLADLAGLGRAARWVGRTLSQLPEGSALPWHRVLGAGGRLSLAAGSVAGQEQRARLRSEGVTIHNDRVDIRQHGWRPMEHSG
jgi:methylated-DNA-protein-cysteine methyltransferase-like protein